MSEYTRPREVRIILDVPIGWDDDDLEYLMERIGYVLARDLSRSAFTVEEIIK